MKPINQSKKVVVTGASGWIGRHVVFPLEKMGYEVHTVSSQNRGMHQANLLNPLEIEPLLRKIQPTHLLHLAWEVTPGQFWNSPLNLSWVEASLRLVQAFWEGGGERVVAAGSCAEYDWNCDLFSETSSPFRPATLYGVCKRSLFQMLESYARQNGKSFAWGYVFNLYGKGEDRRRFVPHLIRGLLKNETVSCTHGLQVRDYLHVEDVGNAFAALLDSKVWGGVNIGSGEGASLVEIGRLIEEKVGGRGLLEFGKLPAPLNDPPKIVAEVQRLKEEVGFSPHYTMNRGIEEAVDWWKNHL